jgi:hypothetical protein
MSVATVKLELSRRTGRNLLPSFFPVDLLIALIRELALLVDSGTTNEEIAELAPVLRSYIRELVKMQDAGWLTYLDENENQLIPGLCEELYVHARDELVSRLVEYDLRKESLNVQFAKVLTRPECNTEC